MKAPGSDQWNVCQPVSAKLVNSSHCLSKILSFLHHHVQPAGGGCARDGPPEDGRQGEPRDHRRRGELQSQHGKSGRRRGESGVIICGKGRLFVSHININLSFKSEENSRVQSSDMGNRGGDSEGLPEPGGCCCGCGWKVSGEF